MKFQWEKNDMRKDSGSQNFVLVLMVVGVLLVIGFIGVASEPKCIAAGCNNKQASGSSYCYLHKPYSAYTGKSSAHSKSSSSSSSKSSGSSKRSTSSGSTSSSGSSYKSSTKKSTGYQKKITYDSRDDGYDDGYDDIYMDGDYDYDRYDNDSDYASGVDDTMDECDGDW